MTRIWIATCFWFIWASSLSALEFTVAPNGNDSNAGSVEQPFATLQRARQEVRKQIASGLKEHIQVQIREGVYYLPEGLVFTPEDSGTTECAITWEAYPNESPELIGGTLIKEWRPYKEAILEADIPEGVNPNQLFENDQRLPLARFPNEGYLRVEASVPGREKQVFQYRAEDLNPGVWDLTEGQVFSWPENDWSSQNLSLAAINAQTRQIELASPGRNMNPGNRFFLQNILALLDRQGECQINLKTRKIYAWPRQAGTSPESMIAASAKNLISVQGPWEKPVRNLHFEGLHLNISSEDLLLFSGAKNCSVVSCLIENGGGCGVAVYGYSQKIRVENNLIRQHGYHGVNIGGPAIGQRDVNHDNTVENNHIHHCGRLAGDGFGIGINQSGNNRIVHNDIHHMPRYGTSISSLRFQALRQKLPQVTFENRFDYLYARKNLLAYNHIHQVNQDSQDTGAMQAWGSGRDNVLDHNLIHDTGNKQLDLQSGIYLDDAADYFAITNNIIYGVTGTHGNQAMYIKGIGNRIENNILIVDGHAQSAIRSFFMADERCDTHIYRRNIIALLTPESGIYDFNNWSDDRVAECDWNLYFNPNGALKMLGQSPGGPSYETWRAALGGKFDAHSVSADPLFTNPGKRDYSLRPDSPALKLGFKPIETREIGLTSTFPKRFQAEPDYIEAQTTLGRITEELH
ncbi:MAG TPA: right-handed parallel beta-helix repeat-containing protein [Candidatus Sumerlaeota bacterium]|nr:right-handed parallel beta-helix repeat-containing protein [Candidatus Sumerlaeota bacterium]